MSEPGSTELFSHTDAKINKISRIGGLFKNILHKKDISHEPVVQPRIVKEVRPPSLSKDEYLKRMGEQGERIGQVIAVFNDVLSQQKRSGLLAAVGGTVYKSEPENRKDIDLVLQLSNFPQDPQEEGLTREQYAEADFEKYLEVAQAISESTGMELKSEHPELSPSGYLITDGKLVLDPNAKMPIELIRSNQRRTEEEFIKSEEDSTNKFRPYVILASIQKQQ